MENNLSGHKMGLALALYITLASGQNAVAAPDLTVTGTVSIDHPAAITVQANLPTNGIGPAKIGDLIYRGDVIQTGPDGNLGVAFADGSSAFPPTREWKSMNLCIIPTAISIRV